MIAIESAIAWRARLNRKAVIFKKRENQIIFDFGLMV